MGKWGRRKRCNILLQFAGEVRSEALPTEALAKVGVRSEE